MAPSVNPTSVVRFQSSGLGSLPISVGSPTVQPSRPLSKSVIGAPGTWTSSIHTPRPWVAQSLAYEIETVTFCPAYAPRSNSHFVQPADRPEAAFQPSP